MNKGKNRPYNNLELRIKNLKKTKLANEIIFFKEKTPIKLIKKIKPDVIVKGSDYLFSDVVGNKVANIIIFKKKNKMSSTKKLIEINNLN